MPWSNRVRRACYRNRALAAGVGRRKHSPFEPTTTPLHLACLPPHCASPLLPEVLFQPNADFPAPRLAGFQALGAVGVPVSPKKKVQNSMDRASRGEQSPPPRYKRQILGTKSAFTGTNCHHSKA